MMKVEQCSAAVRTLGRNQAVCRTAESGFTAPRVAALKGPARKTHMSSDAAFLGTFFILESIVI